MFDLPLMGIKMNEVEVKKASKEISYLERKVVSLTNNILIYNKAVNKTKENIKELNKAVYEIKKAGLDGLTIGEALKAYREKTKESQSEKVKTS